MNQCDIECEQCPYDKSHMILKSRMLTHLAKCAKNFPDCEKQPCMYNKKHVIPHLEMKYHLVSCPDRIKMDMYKLRVGEVECPVKTEVPITIEMPDSEENWDDDSYVADSVLNRIKEVGNKDIILTTSVIGKSKKKRKEIRKSEILRHSTLKSNTSSYQPPLPTVVEKQVMNSQPIRAPTEITNISSQIHSRLRKKEGSVRSATSSVVSDDGSYKVEVKSKTIVTKEPSLPKSIDALSEEMKNVKLSSKAHDASLPSRATEHRSYSSLLAERQREAAAKKLNAKEQHSKNGTTKSSSSNSNMQVLSSSIFENGPRGRGRPVAASPVSNVTPRSSTSTPNSSLTSDVNFLTDEHGFLHMPVPGKGRGRMIYS